MSMFDYDARPVTPGVVLVGTPASRGGYAIRDFLSRNGYPFEWVDAGQPDAVRAVLDIAEFAPGPTQVRRSGYGAMQLAGPYAFGTPPDRASAIGVLQATVAPESITSTRPSTTRPAWSTARG